MARVLAALMLALTLLAGCADQAAPPGGDQGPGAGEAGGDQGADDGNAVPRIDDGGRVGSAGAALLSPAVAAAVVEVDVSPGADPAADLGAVVAGRLRSDGAKREVATLSGAAPAQEVYTADDLRAIERSSREARSEAARAAVYVLVLEGRYQDESATGVAFGATSFAVFPQRISGGLLGIDRRAYETAVATHEVGHLYGLVDLTGDGGFHEDPEHEGHSANRGSVMFWAVEDVSIRDLFAGGPPQDFDDDDRREMEAIRGS